MAERLDNRQMVIFLSGISDAMVNKVSDPVDTNADIYWRSMLEDIRRNALLNFSQGVLAGNALDEDEVSRLRTRYETDLQTFRERGDEVDLDTLPTSLGLLHGMYASEAYALRGLEVGQGLTGLVELRVPFGGPIITFDLNKEGLPI